jgi:transitional endoplasmic reticulum ATPase
MKQDLGLFAKGDVIADEFKVQFLEGRSYYSEFFRVKSRSGKVYQLELLNTELTPNHLFNPNGHLIHCELLADLSHPNLAKLNSNGKFEFDDKQLIYLLYDYISGESIIDRIRRDGPFSKWSAIPLIVDLLNAVDYLHSQRVPLIHNTIHANNVKIDVSGTSEKAVLIKFEQIRKINSGFSNLSLSGTSLFHLAPEVYNGVFTPQGDIYSIGALLYQMLFGIPPWYVEIDPDLTDSEINAAIVQSRKQRLQLNTFDDIDEQLDDHIKYVLSKSLALDYLERYDSAKSFINALADKQRIEILEEQNNSKWSQSFEKKKGAGFKDVAGMQELKTLLQSDVIEVLKNPEKYKRYGISILNGLLLYGPPGCGKTFVAQKFAEEVAYNFIEVKPSDLQSKYINATQENIATLFKEAEKKAPTVIFIDELDAVVPSREQDLHQMHSSAVNELLARMTNCGERGIFVIGATNRPERIDSAFLRTGRMDKLIFLPPPDLIAREAIFKIHLQHRPTTLDIDFQILAEKTELFVSSDIKFLTDEASKIALKSDVRISMDILLSVINNNSPSVTASEIERYEIQKKSWDKERSSSKDNPRKKIGFQ